MAEKPVISKRKRTHKGQSRKLQTTKAKQSKARVAISSFCLTGAASCNVGSLDIIRVSDLRIDCEATSTNVHRRVAALPGCLQGYRQRARFLHVHATPPATPSHRRRRRTYC